ncbi:MAG: class I SAM-dependent methyltransferase [Lachnospiraceae bacterium]|nr:class I SAM-dependent methyltransferase [Lachnospiraceae bacterium]
MSERKGHIKISGRMSALIALVTPGQRLADVGCDHGYIPIYLCREGIIPSAIAMDINPGPLARAQDHIAACGLRERIQTRLSDGLKELGENEADAVLIAGMGGFLMRRILCEEGAVPENVSELVLQPQSDADEVRRCVREIGFVIADEDMVEEDGKFYPMMKARRRPPERGWEQGKTVSGEQHTERGRSPEPERAGQSGWEILCEDMFGPVLLRKRHPVLLRWLERELKTTEAILSRLNAESADRERNGRLAVRKREITERYELLLYVLKHYFRTA